MAGQRRHGTTFEHPIEVFEQHERAHLQPYEGVPFDVPIWREATVHLDYHISFQSALYSASYDRCTPRTVVEVRGDRQLVRLYHRGVLVAVHLRKPKGGRSTDPTHYPPERAAYALRSSERIIQQARFLGSNVGTFAEHLVRGMQPWGKLRQAQKLLRLAERYGIPRTEQACAYALSYELINVRRLEHILEHALDELAPSLAERDERVDEQLPSGRFARLGIAFDHRFAAVAGASS